MAWEPIFIEPQTVRDAGDCAVCCLAMYLGHGYRDVVRASPRRYRGRKYNVVRQGMSGAQMIATAKRLGDTLEMSRAFDVHEDTGILTVVRGPKRSATQAHAVCLVRGSVVDPTNGRVWLDVETFFRAENWRPGTLLRKP